MNRNHVQRILDCALAACVLYFSVWLYEVGNYLVLHLSGAHATIVLNGIFPAGVVAVGGGPLPGTAKLFQVVFAMGVLVPAYVLLRRGHSVSLIALLSVIVMYLTSFYWEFLSLVGPIPLVLHAMVYALLSLGALVALIRVDPRLKWLR